MPTTDGTRARTATAGRRYLLFAGRHDTPGGLRDFVGLFDDEAAARGAFAAVRLSSDYRAGWAELAAVDSGGNVALLCWFGHDRPTPGSRRVPPPGPRAAPRRFWRRLAPGAHTEARVEASASEG